MKWRKLTRLVLIGILLGVSSQWLPRVAAVYSFPTSGTPLDASFSIDDRPAALQAANGTLWATWESARTGQFEVYVKTYNGVAWSATKNVTGGPLSIQNFGPSISQLQNGTIILVWTSNQTGFQNLFYKTFNGGVWSSPHQLTSAPYSDLFAKTVVSFDGSLWVFWHRQWLSSSCLKGVCREVFYKTLKRNVVSSDTQLTTDNTYNQDPSVMLAKNGSIWVSYSKWITSIGAFNNYYRFFNGTQWSSERDLTVSINSGTVGDQYTSIVQDRNGTIWLFWAREFSLGSGVFQDKLFYKWSGDAGITWSPEIQLTFGGNSTVTIDDVTPFAVQGASTNYWKLWVFYSSDNSNLGSSFDIYYLQAVNPIYPVHDIAVTSLQVSLNYVILGITNSSVVIQVTVANLGDYLDFVQLTVQAIGPATYVLGSASGNYAGGGSVSFQFVWNAASATPGIYMIRAYAVAVPNSETAGSMINNLLIFKWTGVYTPTPVGQPCLRGVSCPV